MKLFTRTSALCETRWSALVRIMLGRLIVLGAVLVVLIIRIPLDAQAAYAVIALAFVVNIPYALWLRKDGSIRSSAPLQFLIDVVVVTGIVHFTGGIESELFLLYPLVILSAGIIVSAMHSLKMAMFSIFAYTTLIVLELEGVMTYHGHHPDVYDDPAAVIQNLMTRVFIFVIFSAASHLLASRCNYQARQLRAYQEWVLAVFDNVSLGIITLSTDHTVMFVNRTASKLLEASPESLVGKSMAELFAEPAPTLRDPLEEGRPWRMTCGGEKSFPAMFTASRTRFLIDPQGAADGFQEYREQEVIIMAIRDVTRELETHENRAQVERLQVAFDTGLDLAKSVRTPLDTLKNCSGLLHQIFQNRSQAQCKLSDDEQRQAEELAAVILNQSVRLNRQLDHFLIVVNHDLQTETTSVHRG